jgi:hypothetical protein
VGEAPSRQFPPKHVLHSAPPAFMPSRNLVTTPKSRSEFQLARNLDEFG